MKIEITCDEFENLFKLGRVWTLSELDKYCKLKKKIDDEKKRLKLSQYRQGSFTDENFVLRMKARLNSRRK